MSDVTPIPLRCCLACAAGDPDAMRNAEKMIDLISQSKQLQEMMMKSLPAFMRSEAMMQKMFSDPTVKQKLAEMIASKVGVRVGAGGVGGRAQG